jgi:hypothetical protein
MKCFNPVLRSAVVVGEYANNGKNDLVSGRT